MEVGRLAVRAVIGTLFIGHGTQKLFGWFDGPGLEGTDGMMNSLGMRPARRNSLAAGITETAGGTMLALGLATPLASAGLIGIMITAIRKVHLSNGPWVSKGGYEYNVVLIAGLLALAEAGPGDLSVDSALGWDWSGTASALAALGVGAAVSTAVIAAGQRASAAAESKEPAEG